MNTLQIEPLTEFFDAIKNRLTKQKYEKRLDLFFRHTKIRGATLQGRARSFAVKAKKDHEWASYVINSYMRFQKERAEKGEIAESTVPNYYKPIKLFCVMNDIILNWEKIQKRIPKGRSYADDRAYTRDEIVKLISYPDRRIRSVVLTHITSGIREESWNYLSWKDIEKIEEDGKVVAAKVIVYRGTKDQYSSRITAEAYEAIEDEIKYRESQGERITDNSPVVRDLFHPDRGGRGEPHNPKRLKSTGVKRLIEDALWATGIRKPLPEGKKRHDVQAVHGFRKYFKTVCERHMKSLYVEMLMGHSLGLGDNYARPSERELTEEYLKGASDLIISEDRPVIAPKTIETLQKKISELEESNTRLWHQWMETHGIIESLRSEGKLPKQRRRKGGGIQLKK